MTNKRKWDIIIVGGGLAGLTTALHLAKKDVSVCLIEKNEYPNHKVCGEYVSNEVLPYLQSLNIDPFSVGAKNISKFKITDIKGNPINANLPLGGFGISRYAFDQLIYNAVKNKVHIVFDTVEKIIFQENQFSVTTQAKDSFLSEFVVGAFGKRSNIDSFLNRKFMKEKSSWLAVKAHYNYDFPEDTVALHNFEGGYCGLSKTEKNTVNACYLATFKSFKKYGDIDSFQEKVLSQNPFLNNFFSKAEAVSKKPLTISQISFHKKQPVENHIFMVGDSAGLIHPLCGNGMAMAIKSAQIFSELFLESFQRDNFIRATLEKNYTKHWLNEFEGRLKTGRFIQKILMHPGASKVGFATMRMIPSLVPHIIKRTHGSSTL
ncbi:NAD(P)/FAD-dependent oxidoreductase [Aequorivita lipolytica]|uniref:NAD(P)/FAD-dependent oxidoreductase n=1 Tax=Aequorivita lipolytica TaxID=153267 RepID=A0A5C6YMM4_9FLAO|nr:NAD(P)/FAD-dependent oxidoreductase [Aequorivita lipolytica]TXD68456.1 NAD(P)/FAD-dependent oxidoreductase [Aequorivita lipolytica]SRX51397.1 Kynurenine 3-monooxygenase [Aequorivita lipolytica]